MKRENYVCYRGKNDDCYIVYNIYVFGMVKRRFRIIMKSIMISIKPQYCAEIMNGEKTIEVRKNKALANAIQKLIDENGYADIYVYCSKDKKDYLYKDYDEGTTYEKAFVSDEKPLIETPQLLNGKVVFKFRCYKVEEVRPFFHWCIEKETCLTRDEILDYLDRKDKFVGNPKRQDKVYAIHISDLEIFDKPKELNEFNPLKKTECDVCKRRNGIIYCPTFYENIGSGCIRPLTKAPQNFCYIEGELE